MIDFSKLWSGSYWKQYYPAKKNKDSLRRCLRIYATVDRVSEAEELVRRKVIAPYLEEVISEKSFNSDPQGLKGVFQRVLKLILESLRPLILLTQPSLSVTDSSSNSGVSNGMVHTSGHHVLKDFDFLVRAMWPEIVEKFEDNLSFLFSAGNPERFHTNFTQVWYIYDSYRTIERYKNPSEII